MFILLLFVAVTYLQQASCIIEWKKPESIKPIKFHEAELPEFYNQVVTWFTDNTKASRLAMLICINYDGEATRKSKFRRYFEQSFRFIEGMKSGHFDPGKNTLDENGAIIVGAKRMEFWDYLRSCQIEIDLLYNQKEWYKKAFYKFFTLAEIGDTKTPQEYEQKFIANFIENGRAPMFGDALKELIRNIENYMKIFEPIAEKKSTQELMIFWQKTYLLLRYSIAGFMNCPNFDVDQLDLYGAPELKWSFMRLANKAKFEYEPTDSPRDKFWSSVQVVLISAVILCTVFLLVAFRKRKNKGGQQGLGNTKQSKTERNKTLTSKRASQARTMSSALGSSITSKTSVKKLSSARIQNSQQSTKTSKAEINSRVMSLATF